jgi:hypothetical protein
MNRQTSVYTLHVDPDVVDQIAPTFPAPLQDRGSESLSFRAADDAAALAVIDTALAGVEINRWLGGCLTTGLGVHKRTVTRPEVSA